MGSTRASVLQGRKWRPGGVESFAPEQTAVSAAVVLGALLDRPTARLVLGCPMVEEIFCGLNKLHLCLPQQGWTLDVLGLRLHLPLQRQCCAALKILCLVVHTGEDVNASHLLASK